MKMLRALGLLVAVMWCAGASAHARLIKSDPMEGSTLVSAPRQLALQFDQPIQLTALSIQRGDNAAQDLGPLPTSETRELSVPLPASVPGNYIVKWRAAGADGHVMSGKVLFTISAPARIE